MSYLAYTAPSRVTGQILEWHLDWLTENRKVVGLSEGLAMTEQVTWRLAGGYVVLSFDDSLRDLYRRLMPIVLERGLRAVVFLKGRRYAGTKPRADDGLSPAEVLALQEAGIQFGALGWEGEDLTALDEDEATQRLERSREVLTGLLGHPVELLAYPFGRHDLSTRRAADRAGYRYAFSLPLQKEAVCPLAIPRVEVTANDDLVDLRVKSSSWYLPLRMSSAVAAIRQWRASRGASRDTGPSGGRAADLEVEDLPGSPESQPFERARR